MRGRERERRFDVFISYSHEDADQGRRLAKSLYQAGLEVFFDEWEIAPGDVIAHKLDEGIRGSSAGVLICTRSPLSSEWVRAEYEQMVQQAIQLRKPLIPVLLERVDLPPILAGRRSIDFRGADGPEYERRVEELAAALRRQSVRDDNSESTRSGINRVDLRELLDVPPGGGGGGAAC